MKALVLETNNELNDCLLAFRNNNPKINQSTLSLGFVPTMGALHEGHKALIMKARLLCKAVVVSIFVNPLQFNDKSDFAAYPKTYAEDISLCESLGVDYVFCPNPSEIYDQGLNDSFIIEPPLSLTNTLCGLYRPGHFAGMATVVLKLFNLIKPNCAFFGYKDYQQFVVIEHMVKQLFLPITIYGVDTVREVDGLALSSRNRLLAPDQRRLAPIIYETLVSIKNRLKDDIDLLDLLKQTSQKIACIPDVTLEYLTVVNPKTLRTLDKIELPMLIAIAARFQNIRLIDNIIVS